MVSTHVCLPLDYVVQVRALARDIVLCFWAHCSHSASLHPGVYMGTSGRNGGGNPAMG